MVIGHSLHTFLRREGGSDQLQLMRFLPVEEQILIVLVRRTLLLLEGTKVKYTTRKVNYKEVCQRFS